MKHTKLSLNGLLCGLFCLLALSLGATASAHGLPYVLPFQFHTDQDVATLYAGNSERYFAPEKSPAATARTASTTSLSPIPPGRPNTSSRSAAIDNSP